MAVEPEKIHHFKHSWKSMMWTGVILVVLGMLILGAPVLAGATVVTFIGVLLTIGGAVGALLAVMARTTGWWMGLLIGIVALWCGVSLIVDPVDGMIGLTLVIALYLMISGVFRLIYGFQLRPHDGWAMVAMNGAVNFILGIMIYAHWPSSGSYIIGLFLGIDAMFAGFSSIALAMVAKNMSY